MRRTHIEWDPSWDDDWSSAQAGLREELEEEHPLNPEQAVEYYRHGFTLAKEQPGRMWSDISGDLYQDYMSGAPEPGERDEEQAMDWERASEWAQRGWEAGHR